MARSLLGEVRAVEGQLAGTPALAPLLAPLATARSDLEAVVAHVAGQAKADPRGVHAGAVAYLKLAGIVLGGWQMARAALVARRRLDAGEGDAAFYEAKIGTARFYAEHVLAQASSLRAVILEGGGSVFLLAEEQL